MFNGHFVKSGKQVFFSLASYLRSNSGSFMPLPNVSQVHAGGEKGIKTQRASKNSSAGKQ